MMLRTLVRYLLKFESEDLIRYGLIPEFIGRLPVVATLEELSEGSLGSGTDGTEKMH